MELFGRFATVNSRYNFCAIGAGSALSGNPVPDTHRGWSSRRVRPPKDKGALSQDKIIFESECGGVELCSVFTREAPQI